MQRSGPDILAGPWIVDLSSLPIFMTTGDADEAVPVSNTRMWAETMKELKMDHQYKEYPGVTHGPIIEAAMPDIFAFLKAHSK